MIYENKLYRNLMRPLIGVFLMILAILTGIYFGLGYLIDTRTIRQDQEEMVSQFTILDQKIENFIDRVETLVDQGQTMDQMYPLYYEFIQNTGLEITVAFYDTENYLTDILGKELTEETKLQTFQSIINRNLKDRSIGNYIIDRYHSVYIVTRKISDGYVAVYIRDDSLQNVLNTYSSDYVITDAYEKVIAKGSNVTVENRIRKFSTDTVDPAVKNYRMTMYRGLHIYTMKSIIFTKDLYFKLLFLIFFIATILFVVLSRLVRRTSRESSRSIKDLVDEMKQVAQGNKEVMTVETGDEIEYIGENINRMIADIKQLTDSNVRLAYEKKVSEFKTMESQFNPHFLYNTLELISVTMILDQKICGRIISHLTGLLRYSINELSFVRCDEDIAYIERFLEIQKYKFGDSLRYTIEMDPSVEPVLVPKLFLQPAIENSIKYGFQSVTNLFVHVKIKRAGKFIQITIEDNGTALSHQKRKELNVMIRKKSDTAFFTDEHHGLENMYKRLKLLYPEELQVRFLESEQVMLQIMFKDKK